MFFKNKQEKGTTFFRKLKIFLIDHFHLLFKSAAVNHLRIQQCKENYEIVESCNLSFESFTHLKRYQKKVRILTGSVFSTTVSVFVMILMVQVFFPGSRTLGATYTWVQSSWAGGVDAVTTATHDLNKTNWNKFFSKDTNIAATSNLQLVQTDGATTQTSEADFNAGTKTNTIVTNGSIKLDMLP